MCESMALLTGMLVSVVFDGVMDSVATALFLFFVDSVVFFFLVVGSVVFEGVLESVATALFLFFADSVVFFVSAVDSVVNAVGLPGFGADFVSRALGGERVLFF